MERERERKERGIWERNVIEGEYFEFIEMKSSPREEERPWKKDFYEVRIGDGSKSGG